MYGQNAKMSALSSGKLDKYEYLTGEDLGYRPDPVQKAKSLIKGWMQVKKRRFVKKAKKY